LAAQQWPWEARVRTEVLLTRSYEEAAQNSRTRRAQIAAWNGEFASGAFGWVVSPILNTQTRVAVELCPARGVLRAVGYELVAGRELPEQATLVCELGVAEAQPAQVK
jgi:hypothetical protein